MVVSSGIDEKLVDAIFQVFAKLSDNQEQQREIDDQLSIAFKIPRGTLNEILNDEEKINFLNKEELCALVMTIGKVTGEIDPTQFFNAKQISKASKYRGQLQKSIYPITFYPVIALPTGNEYGTYITYRQAYDLYNGKGLVYNYASQRLSKKKPTKDGSFSEKMDIKQRSVSQIQDLMERDKYKPDTIVFNILVDGNDEIEYDFNTMSLTIHEKTVLNIIDGMHREIAMVNVIEKNPDKEGYMWLNIKHYPLSDAQFALGQFNKRNKFDPTLVKFYMGEDYSSQITKDLMNLPEFKNKTSIKTTIDRKLSYLTNYAVLSEAIEAVFSPQDNKERYDYSEVLSKFFSYLIPSYSAKFKNHEELIKVSWFTHHNTFVLFVVVAKKLYEKYGKQFPVDEITRIIDEIDFSKTEGSELNNLLATQGKVNANQIKNKIRKFAEEKVTTLLQ